MSAEDGIAMEDTSLRMPDVPPEPDMQREIDLLDGEFQDVIQQDPNDGAELFAPDSDDERSMDVEHASADDMVAMIDCLQTLGISAEHANRYSASIIRKHQRPPTTFYEAF